jgi:hypothetical protein
MKTSRFIPGGRDIRNILEFEAISLKPRLCAWKKTIVRRRTFCGGVGGGG